MEWVRLLAPESSLTPNPTGSWIPASPEAAPEASQASGLLFLEMDEDKRNWCWSLKAKRMRFRRATAAECVKISWQILVWRCLRTSSTISNRPFTIHSLFLGSNSRSRRGPSAVRRRRMAKAKRMRFWRGAAPEPFEAGCWFLVQSCLCTSSTTSHRPEVSARRIRCENERPVGGPTELRRRIFDWKEWTKVLLLTARGRPRGRCRRLHAMSEGWRKWLVLLFVF